MNNNKLLVLIAYIAAMIGFSFIAFLVVDNKDSIFWISYVFLVFSFTFLFGTTFVFLNNTQGSFKGFPANFIYSTISLYYLALTILFVSIFGVLITIEPRFYLSIHVFLFVATVVTVIFSIIGKKSIDSLDKKTKTHVNYIRSLIVEIDSIKRNANDLPVDIKDNVLEKLSKVHDLIRFSDPISHESIRDIEKNIEEEVDALSKQVKILLQNNGNNLEIFNTTTISIEKLVNERNDKLLYLKK